MKRRRRSILMLMLTTTLRKLVRVTQSLSITSTASFLSYTAANGNHNNDDMATTRSPSRRRRLIVDTDAGFDDLVAIQCLLAHGHDVDLITTVCGSNTAADTATGLCRLLTAQQHTTTPIPEIMAAPNRPRPEQVWLKDFRQRFAQFVQRHGVPPPDDKTPPGTTVDMTTRVGHFLRDSPDGSINVICLGPLSNLADWWYAFPHLIQAKVASVWILGGAHPQLGRADEFNFGQDAAAASTVVRALAHKIHLVPGDATSHHLVDESFIPTVLEAVGKKNRDDNLLAHVIREEQQYAIFYDPVCIFLYLHPQAAQFPGVALQVRPTTGVTQFANNVPSIPVAQHVDFDAYQTWLLQAIRKSSLVDNDT